MRFLWFFVLLPFFMFSQEERIEKFSSDIKIQPNGEIVVTETIRIYATGDIFKRGIVRTLPIQKKDKGKHSSSVEYNLLSVRRDNYNSEYHTKETKRNLEIYIGEEFIFLTPYKSYTYELTYLVKNTIGFFENYDELYWNVTGNDWDISIDAVSAVIQLPSGANEMQSACYTGVYGSTETNCTKKSEDNRVFFEANNLGNGKGLSVATGFTKGILSEPPPPPPPTFFQQFGWQIITAIFGVILLFYYLFTWIKFGIDPPKPTVVPRFDSPDGLSPASLGLIHKERYWRELLTASIVNLAIKGYLKIKETKRKKILGIFNDTDYELTKVNSVKSTEFLPKEEQVILSKLFKKGNQVTLDGSYDSNIEKLVRSFKNNLDKQWGKLLKQGQNGKFLLFPFFMVAIYFFLFLFLPVSFTYSKASNIWLLFSVFNGLFIFIVYNWLIRKPAKEKLRLQSEIKGLKMYLNAAEEKQLQQLNSPKMTPEIFEQFLPYAIVLNTDKIWGEKFQAMLNQSEANKNYTSSWSNYSGNNFGQFTHAMNSSLADTITTSSIDPSKSSGGSSGGGFSGGGGGGGGGGGW